jgi:hypothetical protein
MGGGSSILYTDSRKSHAIQTFMECEKFSGKNMIMLSCYHDNHDNVIMLSCYQDNVIMFILPCYKENVIML